MKRTRTPLVLATVAALALSACGATGDESGIPLDNPRAPTPIEVVPGGSSGQAGAEIASATDAATTGMTLAPMSVEYVLGDSMPELPTDDIGFVFDTGDGATPEQAAAVAAAFGLDGEPVRIDEGFGTSWRVGPDDGSAPSVWLYDDGQLSWNYNSAWADQPGHEPCVMSVDDAGDEVTDCPEPVPPAGVPTAEQAEERARELLDALDVAPSTLVFETSADEWSANVVASTRTELDSVLQTWSFGYGADGVLQFAAGGLADLLPVGPYPLIDLDVAMARLADGSYGGIPSLAVDGGVVEPDLAVVSGPAPVEGEPTAGDQPIPVEPDGGIGDGAEPLPDPGEPFVVTLIGVQADLWWAWDSDDTVWLLPAYRFVDGNGGWHVVPAVTDEFLIQADPGDGPIPVEPDGGIGDGAEPLPGDDLPFRTLGSPSYELDAAPVAELIGLEYAEFETRAAELGFGPVRIGWQDGEYLPVEEDLSPGRVTVAVEQRDGVDVVIDAIVERDDAIDPIDEIEAYVGFSIEEFTANAAALGFETRVVELDGEPLDRTDDLRDDRVNVVVEGTRVTAIESIG